MVEKNVIFGEENKKEKAHLVREGFFLKKFY